MKIEIPFSGHNNILSLHKKTVEITKDSHLTVNGDCIIGVNANIACLDLPEKFKKRVQNSKSDIIFTIKVEPYSFTIHGKGSEKLTLKHKNDIVLRKSAFVCSRTLAINCDMASDDIPRTMVKKLQNPNVVGKMVIEVK
jgi:hypothetical protein|tara:strand:+ start:314 stop:730 length:417 start_codon:yes stop_codon:yes gene_type:complete